MQSLGIKWKVKPVDKGKRKKYSLNERLEYYGEFLKIDYKDTPKQQFAKGYYDTVRMGMIPGRYAPKCEIKGHEAALKAIEKSRNVKF